jgi:hypothetical protein
MNITRFPRAESRNSVNRPAGVAALLGIISGRSQSMKQTRALFDAIDGGFVAVT